MDAMQDRARLIGNQSHASFGHGIQLPVFHSLQSAILLSKRKPMICGCLGQCRQRQPEKHALIKKLLCCVLLQTKDSFQAGNYNAITTAQREGRIPQTESPSLSDCSNGHSCRWNAPKLGSYWSGHYLLTKKCAVQLSISLEDSAALETVFLPCRGFVHQTIICSGPSQGYGFPVNVLCIQDCHELAVSFDEQSSAACLHWIGGRHCLFLCH